MEFINSSGEAGENMGEELFNVLQRYGLVDGSQKFDLGELVVKADDSFIIPDPTTELAAIAEKAEDIGKQILALNGTITGLDTKIADLKTAIESTTDPELKEKLKGQLAVLEAQKTAAESQLEELTKEAYGLKAQHAELEKTATRLGLGESDGALAAAKHITDLQAAIDNKDFTPEINLQPIVNVIMPEPKVDQPRIEEHPTFSNPPAPSFIPPKGQTSGSTAAQQQAQREFDFFKQSYLAANMRPPSLDEETAERNRLLRKYAISSFRKGGMVDYNGLAMVHGSRTAPEAVLSAEQTQMFMGLRDTLSNLSLDGSAGSSINIEGITIKTESMNNNQDFNRAGEVLAEAFQSAINRRGVTVNTKR
jgi:chaperonin cofactor prefoldin